MSCYFLWHIQFIFIHLKKKNGAIIVTARHSIVEKTVSARILRWLSQIYAGCILLNINTRLLSCILEHCWGVPNDGFLLLYVERSLEMHSKRRYKICIFSVMLGEMESFRNYKGFSIIFPISLDVRSFLIPLSVAFLNPKILAFLFCTKNRITWEVKCEN